MADYKSSTDEGKCIFCEIVKGNVQTPGIFWEDNEFMAFLSKWPNTEGFTVLIPKEHFGSDALSMPDDKLSRLIIAAKKVAKILTEYFDDVGRVGLITEGTGVNHAHVKLYPMHGTQPLKSGKWEQYHSKIDTFFDIYPGSVASNDGPEADDAELKELAKKLRNIRETN